ncbi:MAG: efflux RND transporter permease subunit [Candidatus Eisenbacteria bacterium]|nr:efflux RND transporter permease subunit [Candidatus Eisenbacteria bacterium]
MLRGAIQRPIAVAMLFLALVLIGAISYKKLPVDLLPSIVYPRLTVVTTYEEIPAEDLERMVTQPIEEVATALTGVRSVSSRTREGVSMVTVEYEWGTQMDFANLHLREAIDRVSFRDDFPEDAERPLILRWDPTSRPISILVLEGDGPIQQLTEFATEVVKPALEQVDGVSQAEVVGGADREILVEPKLDKLSVYGVTVEQLRQTLASSNVSFPGGQIRQGPLHLSLRINGEFEDLEQIRETEIQRAGLSGIRVGDVADVRDTTKELEGVTLLGERPVVSILLYKEPEANTISVSEQVDVALGVLGDDYKDFQYEFVYRDAEFVRASFQGLTQSLLYGAVLAFFVLFFFLADIRSTIVVGLSIPISVLVTFALLYFAKVKLNLMSLGGLSLAVGMLVDNAIVVLENITRHIAEDPEADPAPERDASALQFLQNQRIALQSATGTEEVARAVVAATLTTVAVFFPVVYVPGIAGAFFRDQALTVTFSLLVSIATALLLQPVLSARILRPTIRPAGERPSLLVRMSSGLVHPLLAGFDKGFTAFRHVYHGVLRASLDHKAVMLGLLLLLLLGSGLAGALLPRSFMPERTSGDLRVELELAAGTPLEETTVVTEEIASWLEGDPAVRRVFSQVGRTERTLAAIQDYTAPHTSRLRIFIEPGRHAYRDGQRIRAELTDRLEEIPGITFAFREEGVGLTEILSAGGAPFSLGVIAERASDAVPAAEAIAERLGHVDGLRDIQVDRVLGTPNVVVRLDREEILRSGLDPDQIGRELRGRIAGSLATTFNEIEQRIDIAVRLPEETRRDLSSALATPVEVAEGRTLPLRTFVDLREEQPVRELIRKDQRRMVTISANVEGRSLGSIWKEAEAAVDEMELPPDVTTVRAGEDVEMAQSFKDLAWALLLAVVLVYMILAAQFESFLDPLLVAAVLPIGVAGAALALVISGSTVNIMSLIGLIALLGIAVNDAIVKIDTIRRLRTEGLLIRDAIFEASRLRVRPILMTTLTTVLAMAPMAIGLGSGEQLQRPLAITIMGGLLLTTALTLIYTPLLYELSHREGDRA